MRQFVYIVLFTEDSMPCDIDWRHHYLVLSIDDIMSWAIWWRQYSMSFANYASICWREFVFWHLLKSVFLMLTTGESISYLPCLVKTVCPMLLTEDSMSCAIYWRQYCIDLLYTVLFLCVIYWREYILCFLMETVYLMLSTEESIYDI